MIQWSYNSPPGTKDEISKHLNGKDDVPLAIKDNIIAAIDDMIAFTGSAATVFRVDANGSMPETGQSEPPVLGIGIGVIPVDLVKAHNAAILEAPKGEVEEGEVE